MVGRLFNRKKSLDEIEDEVERKESENKLAGLEFSITQKREMAKRLKERGLTAKHFGLDFGKIYQWLKTH